MCEKGNLDGSFEEAKENLFWCVEEDEGEVNE
jgi:hypothetical protein